MCILAIPHVVLLVAIVVLLLITWGVVKHRKSATLPLPAEPVYDEVYQDRDGIELETNECYQQNIKLDANAAYGQILPA